jgi:DNA-binding response OmpR family regulator
MDGYEVCRRVREDRETNTIPIIMVSALGSEEHRLNGFKLGIDDYIGKPFSPREVLARVKAVLQRASPPVIPKESYVRGDLVLEGSRFSVSFRGIRVELTAPEWTILRQLAESPGSSVPREVLVSALWGEDGLIHEHELERIIQGLRQKFESGQDRIYAIPVVPEIGFRLSRLTPPHRPSSEG